MDPSVAISPDSARYNWIWTEVARVKRQHVRNQHLFTHVECSLLTKSVFDAPSSASPYPVGHTGTKPTGKDVSFEQITPHESWTKLEDVAQDLLYRSTQGPTTKLMKRTAARILFVLFADLKRGHLALTKLAFYSELARNMNIVGLFTEVVRCAMRMAYLREVALYHSGGQTTRVDAQCTVFDLADMIHIPPMEFRFGATCSTILDIPARTAGHRGLRSFADFCKRLSILTYGLFQGVTLCGAKYKAYLCGSCVALAACVNPLENTAFLNSYYRGNEVINKTRDVYVIEESDSQESSSSSEEDNARRPRRSQYTRRRNCWRRRGDISPQVPTVDPKEWINMKHSADIDVAVECDWEDFDNAIHEIFAQIQMNRPNAYLEKVTTENKHKYFVKGIERDIDFFHVNNVAYVVSKFHLDCVRCYTDGVHLWCFPSFVAAAHTSMNVGVRWTSNKKDPKCTVLKYCVRGWGTILSPQDTQSMREHIGTVPKNAWEVPPRIFEGLAHFADSDFERALYMSPAVFKESFTVTRPIFTEYI